MTRPSFRPAARGRLRALAALTFAVLAAAVASAAQATLGAAPTVPSFASVQAGQSETLSAGLAVARGCFAKLLGHAPGVDSVERTTPVSGRVRARLTGGGDWDVAVFDKKTGAVVAASAGMRTNEVADGYVTKGQELVVQVCRYGGEAQTAQLAIGWIEIQAGSPTTPMRVVDVNTPRREDKRRLQALGVDLTEGGGERSLQVLLRSPEDERRLREAGFTWEIRIPDLKQHVEANARADQRYARAVARSPLPSGRTTYRHLYDYEYEMKELARRYPAMVRPFVLSRQTVDGRDIGGIEIALAADNIHDGKPVFLNMGVHHGREWPSGEHAMEWAYDLLTGYSNEVTELVRATRNVVIPIVNPDGFTVSREAPAKGDFSGFDYEMKRKNCQVMDAPPELQVGPCASNPGGRRRGTDLNRNYPGFWGGAGASTDWQRDTFRGAGPASEPEVQAIREFVSSRQVTSLITNHTYSNLILRVPSLRETQPPLDEPMYAALGQKMADHNGYANEPGWQLHETTGSTGDWSFWNTGGFAFTFEIGPSDFHPPFETGVVAEYVGAPPAAGAGKGGNREAYLEMLRATVDPAYHSVITGTAPAGWTLRVHKEFATPTSPVLDSSGKSGQPIMYQDVLDSAYVAPGGRFAFHVNPSTRPYVAGRYGRDPLAPPSQQYAFTTMGDKEAWTFTCEQPDGKVASVRSVIVDRGQTVNLGDACRQPGKEPRR